MRHRWGVMPVAALALGACEAGGSGAGDGAGAEPSWCQVTSTGVALPAGVSETSGAAFDARSPGIFWTHNDSGGDPVLYAIGADGRMVGELRLKEARNRDWEDVAVGPCAGGRCAFVGDIGNNERGKDRAAVLYVVPLPSGTGRSTEAAERYEARFPGGGRDAEALFVLPDGGIYVISKGQKEPIELYRWPAPLQPGPVDLVRVAELAPEPRQPGDRVTGASASEDGRWVAVRTYGTLALYRTPDLLAGRPPAFTMDLAPLGEAQGEAVALRSDGTVLLTSESGERTVPSRATLLRCSLPAS